MWICGQGRKIRDKPLHLGGVGLKNPDLDFLDPGWSWIINGDNTAKLRIGKSLKFCQIGLSLHFGGGTEIVSIYCGTAHEAKKLNLKKFLSYPQLGVVIHRYPIGYPQMRTIT